MRNFLYKFQLLLPEKFTVLQSFRLKKIVANRWIDTHIVCLGLTLAVYLNKVIDIDEVCSEGKGTVL